MIRSVQNPTVLFAGGGTGGHLFPGVAVAEELARRAPESRVLLARTQKDAVARHGLACTLETVPVQSPRTPSNPLGYPIWGGRLAAAVHRSTAVLRGHRPHVVVGLGGYGSVAPVLAARALGVPVILLEQNAVPGKATRMLSWFGAITAASFPGMGGAVRGKVVETGNPIRRTVLDRRAAHRAFGLSTAAPVLLVAGGSLGASGLNRRVADGIPSLVRATGGLDAGDDGVPWARFQVIHAAGSDDEAIRLSRLYAAAGVRACVRAFFDDMGAVYGTADAFLGRAGGTTIAELAAAGLPAIFVPYPHHADHHQEKNALPLAERGAAVVVREGSLSPDVLAEECGALLRDASLRRARADVARSLGRPDAAARVVDLILALAPEGKDAWE